MVLEALFGVAWGLEALVDIKTLEAVNQDVRNLEFGHQGSVFVSPYGVSVTGKTEGKGLRTRPYGDCYFVFYL